jgi:membrane-associated phospholipid phosphatase
MRFLCLKASSKMGPSTNDKFENSEVNSTWGIFTAAQRRLLIRPLQKRLAPFQALSLLLNECILLMIACWAGFLWTGGVWNHIARGFVLIPLNEMLNCFIKQLFRHPRPGWISHEKVDYKQWNGEFSFPSSDAQMVIMTLAYLIPDQPMLHTVVMTLFGVNRLFTGAHYLHDVLMGTLIGYAATQLFIFVDVANLIKPLAPTLQYAAWTLLGVPLVLLEWYFYTKGYSYKHPVDWDKQASSAWKDKKILDTTEAHLKQFLVCTYPNSNPNPYPYPRQVLSPPCLSLSYLRLVSLAFLDCSRC